MMKKIPAGVYGLNPLMFGGINENTITVVIGAPGAGKTTFAMNFLRRGLDMGEDAIFITLDEAPEQVAAEAVQMGWDSIQQYLDEGSMIFVDASGKQFTNFIQRELGGFVAEWAGHRARIVIDPLTPVLWSVKERYEQREVVSYLLREARKVGTVLCTLEEHGVVGDLSGPELVIPMYLADNVIHLRYRSHESPERREMKIIKCRSSQHSRYWHPYRIIKGAGIVIQHAAEEAAPAHKVKDFRGEVKRQMGRVPPDLLRRMNPKERDAMLQTLDALSKEYSGEMDP
ncbi:MAG: ATPase domain-containing protein, partial [Candidatus Thermoplasmatota archaeon]